MKNKICPVCKREHKRKECPFCRRLQKWEIKKYQIIKIFPLRIQKKIFKLTFPDEYNFIKWDGVYINGQVRSGKTTLACWILLNRLCENYLNNKFETALFISAEDFIQLIKNTYHSTSQISEGEVLDKYKNVDLLVLDDIGIRKTTDWSYSIYYQLINYRYENLKPTIFTSNVSKDHLAEEMHDDRIPSRIEEMCTNTINL